MTGKIVFAGECSGGKVYWDGKGWTANPAKAKRFEKGNPIIIGYDDPIPLSGIDVFFVESVPVRSPKDWLLREPEGDVEMGPIILPEPAQTVLDGVKIMALTALVSMVQEKLRGVTLLTATTLPEVMKLRELLGLGEKPIGPKDWSPRTGICTCRKAVTGIR